jgi:DNA-binding XRE family transcriptional regulator
VAEIKKPPVRGRRRKGTLLDSQQTTSAGLPAAIVNGEALRALRESLGQSQSQFAPLIGITKSHLSQLEYHNQGVRPDLAAAAIAIARAVKGGTVELPKPARVNDWRQNRKFDQTPPFETRPACPCGGQRCVLWPCKDGEWPIEGHLWCFTGSRCKRLAYVNARGEVVRPIRKNGKPGRPTPICSGCSRAMEMSTKHSSKLDCSVTTFRCRRRPEDARTLKHDQPQRFLEENGTLRPLTTEEVEELHGRSGQGFRVPPKWGAKMEKSALTNESARPDTWLSLALGGAMDVKDFPIFDKGALESLIDGVRTRLPTDLVQNGG